MHADPSSTPTAPPPSAAVLDAPVPARERIPELDVLRGFALFGIFLVNVLYFSGHAVLTGTGLGTGVAAVTTSLDTALEWVVRVFAEGAFYSIFSLLFGIGFGLQLERAGDGPAFARRYVRRLRWLLVIGVLHMLFLWFGDILTTYAIAGLFLVRFRRTPARTLLVWALALLAVVAVVGGWLDSLPTEGDDLGWLQPEALAAVFGTGSYLEFLALQLRLLGLQTANLVVAVPNVLAIFLLGLAVVKLGRLASLPNQRAALRSVLFVTLPLALVLKALYGYTLLVDTLDLTIVLSFLTGGPALGFTYAAVLLLLLGRPRARAALQPLGYAGRMALTNYLAQSVLGALVFYGFGLGLYGSVPLAIVLAGTIALFALQVAISAWWLSRFRFGPAEWLWRSLSYGSAQPFRRE